MARPTKPKSDLQPFTCYLPGKDLKRAADLAKKDLSNQSAIVRRALHLGLEALEKSEKKK